jgi:hypothetical protein
MAHPAEDERLADRNQLQRRLDGPELARVAPHLPPEVLHRLIRQAGLERCVDLVEALSREQLTAVLDLDLWHAPLPGGAEELDADRFGEWLETLVGRDAATAARVLAGWDRSLVVTGLSRYVRVFDPGVLMPTAATDDEPGDNGLFTSDGAAAEVGGYVVQARRGDAWDAIVELLLELSADDAECFHALMDGCRRLSDAGRERDGLDELLDAPDQHVHDVTVDRDDRREGRGFSTVTDARAFLALARQRRPTSQPNPVAAAWMRRSEAETGDAAREPIDHPSLPQGTDRRAASDLFPERLRARLGAGPGWNGEPGGLQPLMENVLERHPDLGLGRGRELAFLANTLVAGCRIQSRSFTPAEASQAVVATCSLGLLRQPHPPGIDYLVGHDLVALFEEGWAALHREVSVFVAQGLLAWLRRLRTGDSDTLAGLNGLQRSLETHLAAGTPWLACEALDVLAGLDTPAWYGLLGLLSECPVIPDAVTATVERRASRIDPNAFAFIATDADIDAVRSFMARVPALLAG